MKHLFYPISRYANRFKSTVQWLNRIINEIIQICSQNNHTQKIWNRSTIQAVYLQRLLNLHLRRDQDRRWSTPASTCLKNPTSTKSARMCRTWTSVWVNGKIGIRKQQVEGENSSCFNTQHCQNRASQQSTNPELYLGSSTSPTPVWRLSKLYWVSRTSVHRRGPAVHIPAKEIALHMSHNLPCIILL